LLQGIIKDMTDEEKKFKVVIIDDDDFLADMYAAKFNNTGDFRTEVYKSGSAFLEKLRGGLTASLILLDIVLPGMDGIEILRQIRKEKLIEGVPVVMLTNQNDEKNISEAKVLGISGYIVKAAATPSEVVAEVAKIIKGQTS